MLEKLTSVLLNPLSCWFCYLQPPSFYICSDSDSLCVSLWPSVCPLHNTHHLVTSSILPIACSSRKEGTVHLLYMLSFPTRWQRARLEGVQMISYRMSKYSLFWAPLPGPNQLTWGRALCLLASDTNISSHQLVLVPGKARTIRMNQPSWEEANSTCRKHMLPFVLKSASCVF